MKTDPQSADPGRRAALKTMGLASAATLAQPIVAGLTGSIGSASAANAVIGTRTPLRIAMLVPAHRSESQAASFANGLDLALAAAGAPRASIVRHDIGAGANRAIALARAQAKRRDCDIAVGLMSSRIARWMQEDLARARVRLIVANAGERVLHTDAIARPFVHTSLELTSGAYAAGRWAATSLGKRCAIAMSEYESGFDAAGAYRAGFESAGGIIVASCTTGRAAVSLSPEQAAQMVANTGADVIGAFFTGGDATRFFSTLASTGSARHLPVVGSAMLRGADAAGMTIYSGTAWSSALANDANRAFTAAYRTRFGHEADAYALLGYDTALLLGAVRSWKPVFGGTLAGALRASAYQSPRGTVTVDAATNSLEAPLYIQRLHRGGIEVVAECSRAGIAERLQSVLPKEHGWISSYMA